VLRAPIQPAIARLLAESASVPDLRLPCTEPFPLSSSYRSRAEPLRVSKLESATSQRRPIFDPPHQAPAPPRTRLATLSRPFRNAGRSAFPSPPPGNCLLAYSTIAAFPASLILRAMRPRVLRVLIVVIATGALCTSAIWWSRCTTSSTSKTRTLRKASWWRSSWTTALPFIEKLDSTPDKLPPFGFKRTRRQGTFSTSSKGPSEPSWGDVDTPTSASTNTALQSHLDPILPYGASRCRVEAPGRCRDDCAVREPQVVYQSLLRRSETPEHSNKRRVDAVTIRLAPRRFGLVQRRVSRADAGPGEPRQHSSLVRRRRNAQS
jgi:hypothetical protein